MRRRLLLLLVQLVDLSVVKILLTARTALVFTTTTVTGEVKGQKWICYNLNHYLKKKGENDTVRNNREMKIQCVRTILWQM